MSQSNKVPVRPASRDAVYDVIDGERDFQDTDPPAAPYTVGEEALLIGEYAAIARATWVKKIGDTGTLNHIRKIVAIGIRALENHGAIAREYHVPASSNVTGTMQARDTNDALAPPR